VKAIPSKPCGSLTVGRVQVALRGPRTAKERTQRPRRADASPSKLATPVRLPTESWAGSELSNATERKK
jgi:hypothetical protein